MVAARSACPVCRSARAVATSSGLPVRTASACRSPRRSQLRSTASSCPLAPVKVAPSRSARAALLSSSAAAASTRSASATAARAVAVTCTRSTSRWVRPACSSAARLRLASAPTAVLTGVVTGRSGWAEHPVRTATSTTSSAVAPRARRRLPAGQLLTPLVRLPPLLGWDAR